MIIRKTREQIEHEDVLFGDAPEGGATTTEEMREFIRGYRAGLESELEAAENVQNAYKNLGEDEPPQSAFDIIRIKEQIKIVKRVAALAENFDIEFMVDEIKREYEVASRQNAALTSIYWLAAKIVYRDLDSNILYITVED